jgi:hypothetical protein
MSKNLKRAALALVSAVAVGGLMLPTAAQAATHPAPAPAATQQAQQMGATSILSPLVRVDVINIIGGIIASAIEEAQANASRDTFVKNQLEDAWNKAGGRYNIMVINTKLNYSLDLKGVVGDVTYHHSTYGYRVLVFESGTVVNRGDGGWINWGFQGVWNRDGGTVNFSKF